MRPAVLVIAGVDSSGGAGLTRDARVLNDLGVDVLCAVTAVTAQSNARVSAVHPVPGKVVQAQIAAAFETRAIGAIKIGMLGTRDAVEAVAQSLPSRDVVPLVLDPVLLSSSGGVLLDPKGRDAMREKLLPRATVVTPNIPEAAALLNEAPAGDEAALISQARRILALGPRAVLLKGGHATGEEAVDLLVQRTDAAGSGSRVNVHRLAAPRIRASCRGTGCALASGIAAGLAAGESLEAACARAKKYITEVFAQASR